MSVNDVVLVITIWIFAMILIFGIELFELHKRISELEREVCIYSSPKIKEITEEATLKEGDN